MPTTLYLHDADSTVAISGKGSPLTADVTWAGANSGKTMDTTQGTAVTAKSGTALAQTAGQSHWCGTWISNTLDTQTISGNTWTLEVNTIESNINMNFWLSGAASIGAYGYAYTFRAGGTNQLLFSGRITGYNEPGTVETLESGTITGAAVSILSGDRIIFEYWWASGAQGMAVAYLAELHYNSGNFAFIQTPQALTFVSPPPPPAIGSMALQPQIIRGY